MAAPTKGNTTNANPTPGANSHTIAHTQNTGSNRLLVVQLTMANTVNYSGVTYGGQALTQLHNTNRGGLSQRMAFFYLVDPPTGNNNCVISFTGSQWNPVSIHIRSFTDSGGVGNYVRSGASSTPNTKSITVSQDDSLIMITSCSTYSILTQQIPQGTNRNFVTHNTNKQVATGAISANAGHSAGTVSLRATSSQVSLSLDRVEIKGLAGSGSSRRRIIIC
tara:strand:- start:1113 stop:1775 length:663 start_codon:yes stop_codon:yes gene_type:complete